MADNEDKTETDLDSNVIESEAEENSEEPLESQQQKSQANETVIIKKGGFISLFSFVLSIVALGACAYLYLESQKPIKQEPINIDVNQWKNPLAQLDTKLSNNITRLKTQIDQAQKQNQSLLTEVTDLKNEIKNNKPLALSHEPTKALYDEDTFSKKIEQLESQILQNKQNYQAVSSDLTQTNNSQKQELTKLQTFFANQQKTNTSQQPSSSNFKLDLAENLLQAAIIQLDVHNNLARATQLLKQASSQVKKIPGQRYTNFAFEIEQTVQTLNNIETLNTDATAQQINTLKTQVSNLEFQTDKVETQEEGSWFDKLVVIRKIEDDDVQKLTAAEQMVVISQLNYAFDMLTFALLSQNQKKWDASIQQINQSLKKHFANNSVEIQAQLKPLAEIKLISNYPSISSLLETFEENRSSSKPLNKE